jgi:alginate O-acetyltransferase complex protein AlgI
MLFNSYPFIFAFLPVALLLYYGLQHASRPELALAALGLASLFFYGYWNPLYVPLLAGSVLFNYAVGRGLVRRSGARGRRVLLALGVAANLALLAYFKYFDFFLANAGPLLGTHFAAAGIVLPLAISFFTFQQIAFLVDASRGGIRDLHFHHYALFVTFFPQLIAGPIVHHREVLPQFARGAGRGLRASNLSVGVTIFSIGLFKKVVVADGLAHWATPLFGAAAGGRVPGFAEAWCGALAYAFQLYYDFSGYSDMAIGLARMFGILLPLNFDSPYKATSIIDFWRRWHMTLSRFLRDYLYIPLGGNRRGRARRYANLMITMLLGGLWHGAAWTFVVWGGLHGLFLLLNHAWRSLTPALGIADRPSFARRELARSVTFLSAVAAFVVFRAADLPTALRVLAGMAGQGGAPAAGLGGTLQIAVLAGVWAFTWAAPNTQEFMSRYAPAFDWRGDFHESPLRGLRWRPSPAHAAFTALLAATALSLAAGKSEFLYFQF